MKTGLIRDFYHVKSGLECRVQETRRQQQQQQQGTHDFIIKFLRACFHRNHLVSVEIPEETREWNDTDRRPMVFPTGQGKRSRAPGSNGSY